jgi:AraC-like DNA-binding protein
VLERRSGAAAFATRDGTVEAPKVYALAYPRRAVVAARLGPLRQSGIFVLGEGAAPAWMPDQPTLLELVRGTRLPQGRAWKDFESCFARLPWTRGVTIGRVATTSLVRRAQASLDRAFLDPRLRIGDIAARLKTSPAHLSRAFAKDLGLTPKDYVTRLRVLAAAFGLGRGGKVVDVALAVGFDDLSRFNKQFRKVAKVPPRTLKPRRTKVKKRPVRRPV